VNRTISDYFKKNDPILYAALQKIKDTKDLGPRRTKDYFLDLCEAIINQQLSDKAAATIFSRFSKLFFGKITPSLVLKIPDKKMRAVGTSWSKVAFLKSLATAVVGKTIDLNQLHKLTDEEVVKELTKIKGIGPWTAEMFLMFSLGRPDVFSPGDVGLKRAIGKLYGNKCDPSHWSPYRTYACRILWRSLE
jgi:DNA-3-methyladenine glycosylase II